MTIVKKYKNVLLPALLLSTIAVTTHAAWHDYVPFRWFKKNKQKLREQLTEQLLYTVASSSDYAKITNLIKKGANINFQDENGMPQIIFIAIAKNDTKLVKLLCEHGANLNLKDKIFGLTPIFGAIKNKEMLEILLQNGANPNVQIISGQTPLILATVENQIEIVQLLLQHGADKNIEDLEGKTAIDYAKELNLEEIVTLLEENKSDGSVATEQARS